MALKTFNCTAFTGGASRALDSYAIATLSDGFRAHVTVGGVYTYMEFDATAEDAERVDEAGAKGARLWIVCRSG